MDYLGRARGGQFIARIGKTVVQMEDSGQIVLRIGKS